MGASLAARGVAVYVADDGAGLPASLDELVGRARAGRGARGRGLAITAEIARAHGGALRAERGRGSRVVLDLPCTSMAEAAT